MAVSNRNILRFLFFLLKINSFTKQCKWVCVCRSERRSSWVPPLLFFFLISLMHQFFITLHLSFNIISMIGCTLWSMWGDNAVHRVSLPTFGCGCCCLRWVLASSCLGQLCASVRLQRLLPEWRSPMLQGWSAAMRCAVWPLHLSGHFWWSPQCLLQLQMAQWMSLFHWSFTVTLKHVWMAFSTVAFEVLLRKSSLSCSSVSPWKRRWALAVITAVNTQSRLRKHKLWSFASEFHFTVGMRCSKQCISGSLTPRVCWVMSPGLVCQLCRWLSAAFLPQSLSATARCCWAAGRAHRKSSSPMDHCSPSGRRWISYLPFRFLQNVIYTSLFGKKGPSQSWQIPVLTCSSKEGCIN